MNSTTTPAGHLRDRDLECARDVVAWAAIDAVHFMATEEFGLEKMAEKVGAMAGLIDALGVDVTAEPHHGALGDRDVTALRSLCEGVANVYNPDISPLVAARVGKAQAVLVALEGVA
jgi:hypothetical protein